VYERVGTQGIIQLFEDADNRPDLLVRVAHRPQSHSLIHSPSSSPLVFNNQVIDPMVPAGVNAGDHYGIPYMYFHTSGLPLMDSWSSFFVRKAAHIPGALMSEIPDDIVSSPLNRLKVVVFDRVHNALGWLMHRQRNQVRLQAIVMT